MKRLERHKRKRKGMHWHIDYFRNEAKVLAALPVRTRMIWNISCAGTDKGRRLVHLSLWCDRLPGRWSIFWFIKNPLHEKGFMDIVERFRMNRLDARAVKEKG